jgi:hypothetical protein
LSAAFVRAAGDRACSGAVPSGSRQTVTRLFRMASVAALLAVAVGPAVIAAQGSRARSPEASPSRLLPLSDKDLALSTETGCQFTFGQGGSTYIFMIGREFLIRTADGLNKCSVSQAQSDGFGRSRRTTVACGGRRLSLHRAGRTEVNPEVDSAGGDAVLTMAEGARSRTIRGEWGTAC